MPNLSKDAGLLEPVTEAVCPDDTAIRSLSTGGAGEDLRTSACEELQELAKLAGINLDERQKAGEISWQLIDQLEYHFDTGIQSNQSYMRAQQGIPLIVETLLTPAQRSERLDGDRWELERAAGFPKDELSRLSIAAERLADLAKNAGMKLTGAEEGGRITKDRVNEIEETYKRTNPEQYDAHGISATFGWLREALATFPSAQSARWQLTLEEIVRPVSRAPGPEKGSDEQRLANLESAKKEPSLFFDHALKPAIDARRLAVLREALIPWNEAEHQKLLQQARYDRQNPAVKEGVNVLVAEMGQLVGDAGWVSPGWLRDNDLRRIEPHEIDGKNCAHVADKIRWAIDDFAHEGNRQVWLEASKEGVIPTRPSQSEERLSVAERQARKDKVEEAARVIQAGFIE